MYNVHSTAVAKSDQVSRSETIVYTESVASVTFPAWFNPLTGMILMSGCGGGGGSGGSNGTAAGGGGGGGAYALQHPILYPPGAAGLQLLIGAAGAAGANGAVGGDGGQTSVGLIGGVTLVTLNGGSGGPASAGTNFSGAPGSGGTALYLGTTPSFIMGYGTVVSTANFSPKTMSLAMEELMATRVPTLCQGYGAYRVDSSHTTSNAGLPRAAASPFGGSSLTGAATPALDGYGHGGQAPGVAAGPGLPGGPGVVVLEFIEGLS